MRRWVSAVALVAVALLLSGFSSLFAQPYAIVVIKVEDLNCNGTPDSGEPLLAGWRFYLDLNGNGQWDSDEPTVTTDQYGTATFQIEKAGTYLVGELPQSGWQQTYPGPPGTVQVTVPPSQEVVFCNVGQGAIGGVKWEDLDGDGQLDNGEPSLQGWTIHLQGHDCLGNQVDRTATTDAAGAYLFDGLLPGTYEVWEELQAGWQQSEPGGTGRYSVTLGSGETIEARNFGNYRPGSIQGSKWQDDDGDGVWDAGEPALAGWTIRLSGTTGSGNTVNQSVVTDANGNYVFGNLPPGTYTVTEDVKSGWTQTAPAAGSYSVNLTSGMNVENLNFGNRPPTVQPGAIRGQKFLDVDGDAVRDSTDCGVDGFEIRLYDSQGNLVATTRTASVDVDGDSVIDPMTEQGLYGFDNLAPGDYVVEEVIPPNWTQTFPPFPGTHSVHLGSGQVIENLLFGNTSDQLDFGDLPENIQPPGTPCGGPGGQCYPTLLPAGANHVIWGPYLGPQPPDPEKDGQPDVTAAGDDSSALDDEDGVKFIAFKPGEQGRVEVTVNGPAAAFPAYLNAWIDFDGDGVFMPHEAIAVGERWTAPGTKTIEFNVPSNVPKGGYARFRVSTVPRLPPGGGAVDGEVEDYVAFGMDMGDAPDRYDPAVPGFPGGYPTRLAQNGARHVKLPFIRIGPSEVDADNNGRPSRLANGDDVWQLDDEDGIVFAEKNSGFVLLSADPDPDKPSQVLEIYGVYPGSAVRIKPLATTSGLLNAWFDWNRDGDWADEGEHVLIDQRVKTGPDYSQLVFNVPADAAIGYTYARFRFSTKAGLSYDGPAPDGEVEDYLIGVLLPLDFGDAPEPYPTRFVDGGARNAVGSLYLGETVDPDMDGTPDSSAMADDSLDATDDEDGILFLTPLEPGKTAKVSVSWTASGGTTGWLSGWIDFNRDGDWSDPGEQVWVDVAFRDTGQDTLTFVVPDTAHPGITYARFRFSNVQGVGPADGPAPSDTALSFVFGEVEDYRVEIIGTTSVSDQRTASVPKRLTLRQNYPNPFNSSTQIVFELPDATEVEVAIYNTMGQLVTVLLRGQLAPGIHRVRWDGRTETGEPVQSGLYLCRLRAGGVEQVRKVILMR